VATISLSQLVHYTDRHLRVEEIDDYPGAVNGLQVENHGTVHRIAAAVDASLATVNKAIDTDADLLLVHHGLFWSPAIPWTGKKYELLRLLLDNNLAVYSAHLPLDMHPVLGNNALLSKAIGLKNLKPFFTTKGQTLGLRSKTPVKRDALAQRLGKAVGGPVTVIPGGPETCRKIGVVTGGAGAEVAIAAKEGVDTFITGEGPHWSYALAEELGVNVLYAGHYATETFGVRALAEHLARKYRVDWTFIDHPTGL
jgi:dinuclear metal center YbgI/SA1388 family protein